MMELLNNLDLEDEENQVINGEPQQRNQQPKVVDIPINPGN